MSEPCTLCRHPTPREFARVGHRLFFECVRCDLRFADRCSRPSLEDEKQRYRLHQNDVHDSAYQGFVQPLVSAVTELRPPPASGLDYGCGPGPVVAHLLYRLGYEIALYDPLFSSEGKALQQTYDFTICSEVAEHFHNPLEDITRLKNLLRPHGVIFFMTLLYPVGIVFEDWHYSRDITHVSFYSRKTFEWIRRNFGFSKAQFRGERVVILH